MNKSEFTRAYADKLGVTIKEAEKNLALFIETLTDCLKNGEYVHVSGFATFDLKDKNARDGVNPLNGEPLVIPACKSPTAKFSKAYKEIFNK
ncbi:MAG: HU family DNA-binding protein [Clostridia bacterium]|nr:HU family DNA-binding protein [Clostridia bacterium]